MHAETDRNHGHFATLERATATTGTSNKMQRVRQSVCLLSVLLLGLQIALLGSRGRVVQIGASIHAEPGTVVGASPATQSMIEALLRNMRGVSVDDGGSSIDSSGNASKQCAEEQGELPRNRILIVHEQHLQSMGCDVRLLRFVKDLLYLNQEVSMLFRCSTPAKMRQPKSKMLASILRIDNYEEAQLRKGLRHPPGIYEWTSAERFAQLISMGYFNVVIIFLWFWYDPQPSAAELMLPLLRAHAPPDKQPFVALLSDDAHSIRCASLSRARRPCHLCSRSLTRHPPRSCLCVRSSTRLGEVEIHLSTRSGYNERARNYWYRQKHMYRLADMVMHISPMDQVAEKESYPFVKYYKLLRMPIRTFRILGKGQVVGLDRSFLRTANIGFIGNGMTPTNHLGIQWFLEHCWEDVQRQLPGVRMRLIGRPPGERVVRGKPVQCVQTEDAHCGWAWGTPYAGAEKENGIDELGYLSAEELLVEVLSWRLMIVPVLRTTGVNTKILVALELGVPLVITPVAASPFDLPDNETIVAFADQALNFVQQTVSVYTVSWLWTQLSRGSRQHWESLATHDPARNDVRMMLSTICLDTTEHHYLRRWTPPTIPLEPPEPMAQLPSASTPRRKLSPCFNGGNWSTSSASPLLLVGSHAMSEVFPRFDELVRLVWEGIALHCDLRLVVRQPAEPYLLDGVDVFLDGHWALPLSTLDGLPHRLVFYHWDLGKMGTNFHSNENMLEVVGAAEIFVAQAARRPWAALKVLVNQEMRSSGGFLFNWRKALTHLGFSKPAMNKIIPNIVSRFETNFTQSLLAHMLASHSG